MYSGKENLEDMLLAENYNNHLSELIKPHLNLKYTIVDFGSGLGNFAEKFKKIGYNLYCVEIDDDLRRKLENKGFKCFKTLDELDDDSIDFIYTLNVIEHIENDDEIIKKFYKKLKRGGQIVIYVPALKILYSTMDKKVGHFRRYSMKHLNNLMISNGFEIQRSIYVDSLGFLITLFFKTFGNKEGNINQQALIIYDRYLFPMSIFLDNLFRKILGKNLYVLAKKPNRVIS
ncbi:class I SAM-dependent methyltransferase [Thermodesulfobium sp. 4217-1]|uniref:class I SAM-dependent methyltransferase n=1 Tax=Thermodesulfobium sp. 4217-1 TaxID=3120013 RepID=UPI003221B516